MAVAYFHIRTRSTPEGLDLFLESFSKEITLSYKSATSDLAQAVLKSINLYP